MINQGLIKTDNKDGKKRFFLRNPTSDKPHWSKPYLNNFDQLKKNEFWDKILKNGVNYLDFL